MSLGDLKKSKTTPLSGASEVSASEKKGSMPEKLNPRNNLDTREADSFERYSTVATETSGRHLSTSRHEEGGQGRDHTEELGDEARAVHESQGDQRDREVDPGVASRQIFFGRRKGRGLRPNPYARTQERLKDLSVERWQGHWPQELWLEIGFGSGEHMTQWLVQHPTRSVIGAEVFLNGLVHCVDHLPKEVYHRCAIFSEPVQTLWPMLPDGILEGITLFFPDPWPKRRHGSRRMVQREFLDQCARLIKPGGFFHFASDHRNLIDHVLKTLEAHPRWEFYGGARTSDPTTWTPWPEDWPSSRYRDKALAQQIPCASSLWKRREE